MCSRKRESKHKRSCSQHSLVAKQHTSKQQQTNSRQAFVKDGDVFKVIEATSLLEFDSFQKEECLVVVTRG